MDTPEDWNKPLFNLLGLGNSCGGTDFRIWQPVTYMFLHDQSGIGHLFFNMFALWMFGSVIERTGGEEVLIVLFGDGCWRRYSPASRVAYGDDSGANGVLQLVDYYRSQWCRLRFSLAFGMLYPNVPMYIMFIPIPVKAKWVVIGYGVIELFAGIGGWQSGVAHFAHLGGMLFGLLLILLWRENG